MYYMYWSTYFVDTEHMNVSCIPDAEYVCGASQSGPPGWIVPVFRRGPYVKLVLTYCRFNMTYKTECEVEHIFNGVEYERTCHVLLQYSSTDDTSTSSTRYYTQQVPLSPWDTGDGTWDMGHMVFRFNTTGLLVTGTVLILKCSYIALLLGTAVLYDIEGENSEKPRGDFGWQESTAPVKLSLHCATKHLVRLWVEGFDSNLLFGTIIYYDSRRKRTDSM